MNVTELAIVSTLRLPSYFSANKLCSFRSSRLLGGEASSFVDQPLRGKDYRAGGPPQRS